MDTEGRVAQHYTHGALEAAILQALQAAGKDPERLHAEDLKAVDEFHLGWAWATEALADDLGLAGGERLLDVGCGIGGPARLFAARRGCQVTGLDLTEEFVQVAEALTRRVGLAGRAVFRQGSALALPYAEGSFDVATLIHVGMNIADKPRLFAEVRRVLRPGGRFGLYDVMQMAPGALPYPLPWSQAPDTSFVETPATYRRLLTTAGFAVQNETDRRAAVLELIGRMRAKAAAEGAPALGLNVLMGAAGKERLANIFAALEAGTIAPVQMIAKA